MIRLISSRCNEQDRRCIAAPLAKRWRTLGSAALLYAAIFTDIPASANAAEAASPVLELRKLDKRVLSIGHRLAVANADLCANRAVATGVMLHSLSQYGTEYRAAAASAFHLGERPSILAVAAEGAAAMAGLREDDAIVRIDGETLAVDVPAAKGSFAATARATELLERQLQDGAAIVDFLRGGAVMSVSVMAEQGCPSRFQVVPSGSFSGKADGHYVQLSSSLVQKVVADEELAAVLAHELSHNILSHRVRLNEAGVKRGLLSYFGKNASRIKQTEIEADRLSVYLLFRAGYPPEAAEAFWRRFGPQHPWGPFGSPTHPGWRDRADMLRAETAALRRQVAEGLRPLPDFMKARGASAVPVTHFEINP